MAAKNGAEVTKRSKKFIAYMNATYRGLLKNAETNVKIGLFPEFYGTFPKVTFEINRGDTGLQTPEHKAEGIVCKRSSTCRSAHLVDAARHINTRVNGKVANQKGKQAKAFGDHFEQFQEIWADGLKAADLRNYANKLIWAKQDPPHVELPNSKIRKLGDPLVQKCLAAYARKTRLEGRKHNTKFEKRYKTALKKHLEKYEELAAKKKK